MCRMSEIFESIQGEGPYVGVPSLFLRLQGCNLVKLPCGPCLMCDTRYAIPTSAKFELTDLASRLYKKRYELLVITGGEPLWQQRELIELLLKVPSEVLPKINVETNGTIAPVVEWNQFSVLFSVSPKVHTKDYLCLSSFKSYKTVLKVVYDGKLPEFEFVNFIFECASSLGITSLEDVFVMPESRSLDSFVQTGLLCFEFCLKYGFRFGPREHLVLFDGKKGM